MSSARRLILHWTAGGHEPTAEELLRYHYLVAHMAGETDEPEDDWSKIVNGVPPERNLRGLAGVPAAHRDPEHGYAAHTAGFNSWSLGVSLCGMRDAVDRRPDLGVYPGPSPITTQQLLALFSLLVWLLNSHNLDPVPDQLFTHYEAETLHGVDQVPKGPGTWKWDVSWVPHRPDLGKDDVGDWLREQAARHREGKPLDLPQYWNRAA